MSQSIANYLCRKGFLAAAMIVISGCAGNGEGLDAGGRPIQPPAPNDDFQEIQNTIFTPVCTVCHSGANAPQGLRLDAGNSYALLVNVASSEVPSLLRINPGNPDASYLVQKIQGNAAVGSRMPANGPPFLSQTQIDLIRTWVAAGAPQSSAPPLVVQGGLRVTSSVPAPGEKALAGLARVTVVFNSDIDASLVNANSFELRDALDQPVAIAKIAVPSGRPNVVEIVTAQQLSAGSYQLAVRGDGPAPLADNAGHRLDGDCDGQAGGDTLIPFDVNAGAAR